MAAFANSERIQRHLSPFTANHEAEPVAQHGLHALPVAGEPSIEFGLIRVIGQRSLGPIRRQLDVEPPRLCPPRNAHELVLTDAERKRQQLHRRFVPRMQPALGAGTKAGIPFGRIGLVGRNHVVRIGWGRSGLRVQRANGERGDQKSEIHAASHD